VNTHSFFKRLVATVACCAAFVVGYSGLGLPAGDPQDLKAAFSQHKAQREKMVRTQFHGFGRTAITDDRVIKAMLRVPRDAFIPAADKALAYADSPVPIGYGQTISQPYIVALMTQVLKLKPGMKVLEIGTGSGYQAAVLAEITPKVYTIEIIEPLYKRASSTLKGLGYDTVTTRLGDGYYGLPDAAPFDCIIVTCAALHIPPSLFKQLKPGGRMVIPVGGRFETQRLLLVSKDDRGRRSSKTLLPVRFVPLVRGAPRND
jgi:protein-L-isoaspartate(D-aspartate) O-methyltransferase